MRWPWRRHKNDRAARARADAEANLAAAQNATGNIERMADALMRDLSDDEWSRRLLRAFGIRIR